MRSEESAFGNLGVQPAIGPRGHLYGISLDVTSPDIYIVTIRLRRRRAADDRTYFTLWRFQAKCSVHSCTGAVLPDCAIQHPEAAAWIVGPRSSADGA